jgi:hypothetical protein
VSDLRDMALAASICTPEQLHEVCSALEVPKAPDVRLAAEELHPINPHESRAMNLAIGLAAVAGLAAGLLS